MFFFEKCIITATCVHTNFHDALSCVVQICMHRCSYETTSFEKKYPLLKWLACIDMKNTYMCVLSTLNSMYDFILYFLKKNECLCNRLGLVGIFEAPCGPRAIQWTKPAAEIWQKKTNHFISVNVFEVYKQNFNSVFTS